jgi:histone deacetylase 6
MHPQKQRKNTLSPLTHTFPSGNGTQDIFWSDPSVLYLSLHRYGLGFFPGTGAAADTGAPGTPAAGRTVNIPFTDTHLTGADYLAAFRFIVLPILTEFRPDLILISAGFDAVLGDPLGKMSLPPAAFGALTEALLSVGTGRVVAALEGGYNEDAIASCAESVVRALLRGGGSGAGGAAASGDDTGAPAASAASGVARGRGTRPRGGTEGALRAARATQVPFWRCVTDDAAAFEAFWAEEREARARRNGGATVAPRGSGESGGSGGSPTRSGGSDSGGGGGASAAPAAAAPAEASEAVHGGALLAHASSRASSPSRNSARGGGGAAAAPAAHDASSPA